MQILGNYQSTLTSFQYQQLVALLQQAVQVGEYSAGQTFDQTSLDTLQQQAQDFTNLPQPLAGMRTTDDMFDNPLQLLNARFQALAAESSAFNTQLNTLLAVLEKDTTLIDQLIFAAGLQSWAAAQPQIAGSTNIMWDFGVGYGPVGDPTNASLWTDPQNGVSYVSRPPLTTYLQDQLYTGLACTSNVSTVTAKNMTWDYSAGQAQVEELSGTDWTQLTLLDPSVLINYAAPPVVQPASSPFVITGISNLGNLPIYIRTSFTPRHSQVTLTVTNGQSISLSNYVVQTDFVFVIAGTTAYTNVTDYSVTDSGLFTGIDLPQDAPLTIYYVENFPSYQCSIDQVNWSPLRMLDPSRPYPETETAFLPIPFGQDANGNPLLPITDELGVATGLNIKIGPNPPSQTYLLSTYSQASPDTVGATAVLEVDLDSFTFLNAIQLSPFTTFPCTLKRVEVQGLGANTRQTVWSGSAVIDRPTTVSFSQVATSTVYLTFYQQNYSLKQQTVEPPNALLTDVMQQLQAILPFNARQTPASPAQVYTGAQYEFGVEDVQGQFWTQTASVFAAGPNSYQGCPEVIRFDADSLGTVSFYLAYVAYSSTGAVVDTNYSGIPLTPGNATVFAFSSGVNRAQVDHMDIYLKIVHRSANALVERYLLQITSRT
jgi:hypothetical protein